MKFTEINARGCEMLGYTRGEALALTIRDIVPAEDLPTNPVRFRDLIAGQPVLNERRMRRKDGSTFPAEISARRLPDGRFLGVVRDISERAALEERLREAQKLEAIGRLAGGVAHDFNNLLTVILGFSETLLAGMPADDPGRKAAEQIRQAAQRAAQLTQQLLAFGRRQVFRLQVFDVNAVATEMREILQRVIGEQIEVSVSPGARLGLIRADRGQIEQVLMNLALNARDAMPEGGRLAIGTRNVGPPLDRPGAPEGARDWPWLLLTVSDTGAGMSPEVQARIFEPFYTTKGVGVGTGLGLSTVHGIVSQSGGRIEVKSVPGEGTTFRILLPCAREEAEPVEAAPVAPEPGGEETVLLVEDEAAVRGLLSEVLRRRGYRVLEAADGAKALELATGHPGTLQLLITDVVMPGMDGYELARRIGHQRPGLKVLFVSGYSDEAVRRRGGAAAVGAFLQKPFTPEVLARRVREVLKASGPGPSPA